MSDVNLQQVPAKITQIAATNRTGLPNRLEPILYALDEVGHVWCMIGLAGGWRRVGR